MAAPLSKSRNRVRIIGGHWRGSRLEFPSVDGLRPSSDRTRETLFNWLQFEVPGSRCLDLFAGSGALGFEALSRGAAYALLLDTHPQVIKQLQQHKLRLKANNCDIQQIDALAWLKQWQTSPESMSMPEIEPEHVSLEAFDIIFLDPPYALNLQSQCLQLIENSGCIRHGGLLYLEQPQHQQAISVSSRWQEIRNKRSSQVNYSLLRFGDQA